MKFQGNKMITLILAVALMITGNTLILGADSNSKASIADNKLSDYIAFYVESPTYYVNNQEKQIDSSNKKVAPYLKNGHIYVPVRFIVEALGGSIEWDAKTKTSLIKDKNGSILNIAANSDVIKITGKNNKESQIKMGAKAELYEGRLYASAAAISEAFGKSVFYERGLIIIAENKNLPDRKKDKDTIDAFITAFTGIINVGSKENLVELIGYDPDEIYIIETDDIPMMIIEESEMAAPTQAAPAPPMANPATGAGSADAGVSEEPMRAQAVKESANDFSETNVQVQGVDEADIIKTDGKYIYYVRNQVIEIVKVNGDGKFEHMSSYKMPANNRLTFKEIFVDGVHIVAIGASYRNGGTYTMAVVINTENKKSPKLERSVEIKGYYKTSRKIGKSVYFVANQYFWHGYGDIIPLYRDSAGSGKLVEMGYDRLRCFPVPKDTYLEPNVTSLVGFNIDRPKEEAFIETILGCGDNIYMSEKAMYIASVVYNSKGSETVIHKFAADDGKFVFVKSGTAPGTVLNQFSMDEYKSHLRIATTVREYSPKYKEYNGLYIFDNTMEIVGRIDDIAPGELIYSARFMGARGYMVTFKTVDPLFAIDLSNPKKPVVLGALKIPGYSNYLHPYDENHLIGFGKDTVVDSYGSAYYTSMKISLFDVTDMTNPIEMFVETIGARGTDSLLLSNHKALLFSKEKGLLAFPVTVYESDEKAVDGEFPSHGTFAFSGAYIYDINLKEGFKLRGKISHLSAQDMLKSSMWGADSDLYINRLLTVNDKLYAASHGKLTSHNLGTLKPIDEYMFKDN